MSEETRTNVTCSAAGVLELEQLIPFQGDLKKLSDDAYKKLRTSILELGISFPLFVWKHKGKYYTLDGHQRDKVLKKMKDEGYVIPKLPVAFIEAKDIKEAKKKVLAISSQYGHMTMDSLAEYIKDAELDFAELKDFIELPQIDLDRFERGWIMEGFKDAEPQIEKQKELKKKWGTATGDLWEFPSKNGEAHRLYIQDSINSPDLTAFLQGIRIDMVCTDPPFDLDSESVIKAIEKFSDVAMILCGDNQAFALSKIWTFQRELIWYHHTPRSQPTMHFPVNYHNHCLCITKGGKKCGWTRPGRDFGSVIEIDNEYPNVMRMRHGKNSLLFYKMMAGFKWARVIAEPFCGTGSVPIACEQSDRRCFSMEIDPGHAAVALERWSEIFPAQKPSKLIASKAKAA